MTFRPILLAGLAIILQLTSPLQVLAAGKKPVTPSQQWSGSVDDLSLGNAVPEVILTEKDWDSLWKLWKIQSPLPKVDFFKNLIVVQTTQGSKLRLAATLDEMGNLEVLGLATRDLRPAGEGKRDLGKTLRQASSLAPVQEASQAGSLPELGRRLAIVGGDPTGAGVGQVCQGQQTQGCTGQERSTGQEIGQEGRHAPHKKGVTLRITPG